MDKPVRTDEDSGLPLSATIAIGGLALLGAITVVSWLFGAIVTIIQIVIVIAVVIGVAGWLMGRKLDR